MCRLFQCPNHKNSGTVHYLAVLGATAVSNTSTKESNSGFRARSAFNAACRSLLESTSEMSSLSRLLLSRVRNSLDCKSPSFSAGWRITSSLSLILLIISVLTGFSIGTICLLSVGFSAVVGALTSATGPSASLTAGHDSL